MPCIRGTATRAVPLSTILNNAVVLGPGWFNFYLIGAELDALERSGILDTLFTSGIVPDLSVQREDTYALAAMDEGTIIFGSGQDGIAVFDGVNTFAFATLVGSVYTLSRDVFVAGGSRIAAGVTVKSAGYKGFCNGMFTIDPTGVLSCDGNAAALGVAGAASALGTLGIGTAGGAGHAGVGVGSAGTNQSNTLQDAAAASQCAGGAGGAGGADAGGAGGTYNAVVANGGANYLASMLTGFFFNSSSGGNQATIQIIGGGSGGGGGGADNAGVTGGGGGGGGGVLLWHAYEFVVNGTARALGGAGAAASGSGGNGGGGGGGGGGIILSLARIRSGSGVYAADGGAGGAKLGASGVAGAAGATGHLNLFSA